MGILSRSQLSSHRLVEHRPWSSLVLRAQHCQGQTRRCEVHGPIERCREEAESGGEDRASEADEGAARKVAFSRRHGAAPMILNRSRPSTHWPFWIKRLLHTTAAYWLQELWSDRRLGERIVLAQPCC